MRNLPLNAVEAALAAFAIAAFSGILATWVAERRFAELSSHVSQHEEELSAELQARYGPERFSLGVEEWAIRDFFRDKRDGVYVDVGAWEWQRGSNTYFLERELGWTGLAVDASREFEEGWRRHRPGARFVAAFVADVEGDTRTLYTGANTLTSSSERDIPHTFGGGVVDTDRVETARLDTLLARFGIDRVDFLTMDIEWSEPAALRGFSIERYRPALVCIEAHMPVRQQILDYFAKAGYTLVGRYLRYDLDNLYFEPLHGSAHVPTSEDFTSAGRPRSADRQTSSTPH